MKLIEFTKYRKVFYGISLLFVVVSLLAIFSWGLNPGIEFSGGSILEAEYENERPPIAEIKSELDNAGIGETHVQPIGERGVLVRTTSSDEETYRSIISVLGEVEEKYFESIGPTVGGELRNKSILAIIFASLLVISYVAISFKGVEGPISSVKYGVVAVSIAIFHDVLIIVGVFSILGYLYGVQMTVPVAVALLTTLGYSINDTVVIFDRVRENLSKGKVKDFRELIDRSLNETMGRSLATSATTLFVLFTVLFFGGSTLFYFILALIMGIILGTYSSVFLAGSILFSWCNLTKKKE